MKKYTKPMIMFESFSLSTCIAGCRFEASHGDDVKGGCKAYWAEDYGTTIFMDPSSGCAYTVTKDDYNVCYHVPSAGNELFGS